MSLVSAPALAQSSASKLSVASAARTSASAKGENLFGGGALVGVLVFAAVVAAIYFVADSSDEPNSP
ncbi:hypothetical protein ACFSCW_03935 [Sphingomonas tabacisoli]|uniref:Uncharacterized protein n=1 Tax=Sphingomonas tabacisoli TaxID=2249466 RepID=A0ABW4HZA8_9SPHN